MVGETAIARAVKYLLIAVVTLILLFPIYWMINMSFKDQNEFVAEPPTLLVQHPTWANYNDLIVEQHFLRYGKNSLKVAAFAATLSVVVGTLAAYALARFRLPGNFNYHLLFTVLTIRMFPPIVTVIPLFVWYNHYSLPFVHHKLIDTWYGLGFVHAFSELPLVVWLMIGFFRDIPRDMEEAALVDGDSRLAVLFKVAIPLARPGLAATFILVFISSWNEFLYALILTRSEAQTLPIAVAGQITEFSIKYGNLMAAAVLTTVPVLVLALLAQRHLTRGLTVGGVTG